MKNLTTISDIDIIDGEVIHKNVVQVDFKTLDSPDPIAYFFGFNHCKNGLTLPKKGSKEYKELAKEYIRGFNEKELKYK